MCRSLLLGFLAMQACGAAALAPEKPAVNITGTWQGNTVTSCGKMLYEQGQAGGSLRGLLLVCPRGWRGGAVLRRA
jgi:hypothetical protein